MAIWFVLAAAAVAGFALLCVGIRGRRIDQHPICRACRFDLIGVYPGAARCPECGAGLQRRRRVRVGNRRPRRRLAAAGIALVLPLVLLGGAGIVAFAVGYDLNRIKPAPWLIYDVRAGTSAGSEAAANELRFRLLNGDLDDGAACRAVDAVLDRQAAWTPEMGPFDGTPPMSKCFAFFDTAAAKQLVSEAQIARAIGQALQIQPTLRTRVPSGGFVTAQTYVSLLPFTASNHGTLTIDAVFHVDGRTMPPLPPSRAHFVRASTMPPVSWNFDRARVDLPPGQYTLDIVYTVRLYPADWDPAAASADKLRATWQVTKSSPIDVVASQEQAVLVTKPDDEPLVAAQVETVQLRGNQVSLSPYPYRGGLMLVGSIDCSGCSDVSFCCDVIVRSGDHEFDAGLEWFWSPSYYRGGLGIGNVEQITTDTIDIILRPDPDAAAINTTFDRIWGEPIIFRDVKVIGLGQSPAQQDDAP